MAAKRVSKIAEHYCNTFNAVEQSRKIVEGLRALDRKRIAKVTWDRTDWGRAKRWQQYRCLSEEEIRRMWSKKGRAAASAGTLFHKVAEWLVRNVRSWSRGSEAILQKAWESCRREAHAVSWSKSSLAPELRNLARVISGMSRQGWDPIHAELKVAALGVTGTIDAVFRHRRTGAYRVIDWKHSKGDTFPSSQRCKKPMWDYVASKGTQWALQVNLYGLLFRESHALRDRQTVELLSIRFYEGEDPDVHRIRPMSRRLLLDVISKYPS